MNCVVQLHSWCHDIRFPAGGTMNQSCPSHGYSLVYHALLLCIRRKRHLTFRKKKDTSLDFELFDAEK